MVQETEQKKSGYGKRPLWQWIVLYLIIGAVVYGLIYYFVIAKKGGYSYNQSGTYQTQQKISSNTSQTNTAPSDNIYLTKTDSTRGTYLTDFQGTTLYTFDKDTQGVSKCYDACVSLWPAYTSGATAQSHFPANITVITRTDGSKQFAWKGLPLYYYKNDTKTGDITGDGVGGVWHIIKP